MQHLVVGMGEIGSAWFKVLSECTNATLCGVDLDPKKCRGKLPENVDVLHICIPFVRYESFEDAVFKYYEEYNAKEIIIHSSVSPGTTFRLSESIGFEFIYSPMRGVHSRMTSDMKRYTKYWASDNGETPDLYIKTLTECGLKVRKWSDGTKSLELAKLLMDVTYYGWLIIFAQHVKVEANRYGVDDLKLWEFTDEIHEFLGNRPRMFSGDGIGGHCVMQDKDLLNDSFLDAVFSHDQYYRRNK